MMAAPDGSIYCASLVAGYIGRVDPQTGSATALTPPTPGQGARRVWSDSSGRVWVSEWSAGQVASYDPATNQWREWKLLGDKPQAYAVCVDDHDFVWLSDWCSNAIVRDPTLEAFDVVTLPSTPANVRQLPGRPGEVWAAESGADKLIVLRTGS